MTKLKYCARSDIGRVRSCDEDAYAIGGGQSDEYPGSLFVVCDGMGGQGAGEVAAQLAAKTIINTYYASTENDRKKAVTEALQAANQQVYQQEHGKSGATVVAALFVTEKLYIAHAGDCRAYQFHNERLKQITEDHLTIEEWIRQGLITREEVRKHPNENRLYRSIGDKENVEVALFQEPMEKGDMILLCTDGVWVFVEDTGIERTFRDHPQENVVERLIDLAIAHGGPDNATAILIWLEE
jgi:PPM family protein phosphatase